MKKVQRPPTLAVAAANVIKDAILEGQLLPGEPLHEVELSEKLNISRGTVREALRLLRQQGLVEVIPYRGAFVACLSPQMVEEIYTLRALLEPYALRLGMEKGAFDKETLDQMAALVKRMGEMEQAGNYSETIKADMRFHEIITERCGHRLLTEVLKNLQSMTLMFILSTKLYQSDMISDEVSHQAVFEGIRSGDPQLAEEILRKHITDAGTSLLQRMESETGKESSEVIREFRLRHLA
ncbi:MAG: GntR family transcriptional regulator [Anaerolineales bacterium]|nr:GntR family transcriptional regulator [Anaerolineales bacterium]MCS7247479.1 GntR family transcriptional regulator [Anaerolineales bacterium]MDW8161290.1 GntR family transcriptional regulator [Anaerolineales bacterium]MDW8446408.1 GntR family transcriptional regulator [Anaerolineales bacterium]